MTNLSQQGENHFESVLAAFQRAHQNRSESHSPRIRQERRRTINPAGYFLDEPPTRQA